MYRNISRLTLEELVTGYHYDETADSYHCLHCNAFFSGDEIFSYNGRFLTARAAIREHLKQEHPDPLSELLSQERKVTGLTENQRVLCGLLAQGYSDREIGEKLGIEAVTVRKQRFTLREHAKVARVQLAIFELLEQAMQSKRQPDPKEELIETPDNPNLVDDRYLVTRDEEERILRGAFRSRQPLRLSQIPAREKKKVVVLNVIAAEFSPERQYTEKEVNTILVEIHDDFAALRRYLIDYGHLCRTADGSRYWLAEVRPSVHYRQGTEEKKEKN